MKRTPSSWYTLESPYRAASIHANVILSPYRSLASNESTNFS